MAELARTQQHVVHARLLREQVASFIQEYRMLAPGQKVLAAVSGGPDSMVLLHLLRELAPHFKVRLHVAHLHHCLRGKDADLDLIHVRDYCKKLKIPFISKRIDVRELARRKRLSLETAARMARYEFLSQCARREGATAIAVGHTADDQVETFLMRLLRGAGGRGLGGMQPVRRAGEQMIIRPLLRTWRLEILSLAKTHRVRYRIDRSNRDISFLRNKVRHRLIAYLQKEYSPRIKEILRRSAEILAHEHAFVHDEATGLIQRLATVRGARIVLPLHRLLALPPALRAELLRIATAKLGGGTSPGYSDIDAVLNLCKGHRGAKQHHLPGGVTASREYGTLILSAGAKAKAEDYEFPLEEELELSCPPFILRFRFSTLAKGTIRRLRKKPVKLAEAWCEGGAQCWPLLEHFSLDALNGKRIVVRNRRPGDRYRPLGMRGTKKLKRIMIDEKLPLRLRATMPLIACGDEIIWLPGYRIADRYRVAPSTQRIAQVSVEKAGEMW
ncbi:MAG: tRNA lysidine(34) synthetase TilS [Candidatus Aureabacteria bacterium]|nr:tRNA lysidine(34) synthetase TilS [Candidatus Auribacterota bacterium]